jgi:hypothetical protein
LIADGCKEHVAALTMKRIWNMQQVCGI